MKKLVAFLLPLALLCAGCTARGNGGQSSLPETTPDPATPSSSASEPAEEASLTLLAAGDNLVHDTIYLQAARRARSLGHSGYDFTFAYQAVANRIAAADLAVLNQETVICPTRPPSSYPTFNSPPELGEAMVQLGFDVFSLSNNHILDQGQEGVSGAADFWDSQPGVVRSGLYPVGDWEAGISTATCQGITLAFVSFTEHTNGIPQNADRYEVVYTSEPEKMERLVRRARELSDLVVVSVHWGVEGSTTVTAAQRALAQQLADWGAGVILGSHPHVLQEIEMLRSGDGRSVPVIYSLGNFISAQAQAPNLIGGLWELEIARDAAGVVEAAFSHFTPLVTHYGYGMSELRVLPLDEYTDALAAQHGVRADYPGFSLAYIEEFLRGIPGVSENR